MEPVTTAHPELTSRTFTTAYDAAGRPVSTSLPGNVSITSTFDKLGNVTGQVGTGAEAATVDREFGYDLAGRLTSASAQGGTNAFSYDERGLLLSADGPSGSATRHPGSAT